MSLKEKISDDLKAAMLKRQKDRLEPLRAVKSAFQLAATEGGTHDISSDQELIIIQKLIKQRKESAEIYLSQNRKDLYDKEMEEAKIIEEYLPEQISEEDLVATLNEIIQSTGASSIKDMGKVMSHATARLAGRADNKLIASKIKELLG